MIKIPLIRRKGHLLSLNPNHELCTVNVVSPLYNTNTPIKQRLPWLFLLLLICVLSRIATTIYYVEDIDCLRFALSATDYDIASIKPHFPGYAVFCFFLKCLYAATGHLAVSFSIIGGVAIFLVIAGSTSMLRLLVPSIHAWVLGILLFFNPQLWVMSNSYMPDLLGLGLLMCCLYFFAKCYISGGKWVWVFYFLMGMLLGVRLSYAPMLVIPTCVLLWKYRREAIGHIAIFSFAVLLWLIPMIIDTGWHDLILAARRQTEGHFTKWGGSVISSKASFGHRIISFVQSAWADGMGGWWPTRDYCSAILSLLLLPVLIAGIVHIIKKTKDYKADTNKQLAIMLASLALYLVWALLFQNIVHKPRHVMPLVPFLCIAAAAGLYYFQQLLSASNKTFLLLLASFLVFYLGVTAIAIQHHSQPSAISQMKDYLLQANDTNNTFVGCNAMGYYISRHYWNKGEILDIETDSLAIKSSFEKKRRIFSPEKLDDFLKQPPVKTTTFDHDPFVNRMWAHLTLYEYQR